MARSGENGLPSPNSSWNSAQIKRKVLRVKLTRSCPILLLAVAAVTAGCHRSSPDGGAPSVIAVELIVANPHAYAHRVITVRGCYVSGFERMTVQPCDNAQHDQMIWVESAEMLHTLEQAALPPLPSAVPRELRTPEQPLFLFKYDEAQSRAAWKQLTPESAPSAYRLEVTVVGQFETVSQDKAGPTQVGFGHLNAYKHQLILVDVLHSKLLSSGQ